MRQNIVLQLNRNMRGLLLLLCYLCFILSFSSKLRVLRISSNINLKSNTFELRLTCKILGSRGHEFDLNTNNEQLKVRYIRGGNNGYILGPQSLPPQAIPKVNV